MAGRRPSKEGKKYVAAPHLHKFFEVLLCIGDDCDVRLSGHLLKQPQSVNAIVALEAASLCGEGKEKVWESHHRDNMETRVYVASISPSPQHTTCSREKPLQALNVPASGAAAQHPNALTA